MLGKNLWMRLTYVICLVFQHCTERKLREESMTVKPILEGQNGDENNQVSQRFSWVGGSKREILVKPHSTIQIPLLALFCTPGTYNLSNLNALVHSGKDSVSVYQLPPYLIVIDSSDAT